MKQLKKFQDIAYDKNVNEDYDTVWVIAGDEGAGKSNLGLHLIHRWLEKRYGIVLPEHIKHIPLTRELFGESLANSKKFDCIDYDEAGDISNRRFMDKFNYLITQTYQVIRGDNLFSILTLPSIFDLDPYFSKRRVRGLIYVYKRGRFAFWSKTRLRRLVALNARFPVKNYWIVKPTYSLGYFPKYEGVLKEPYDKLKAEKMQEKREKVREIVKGGLKNSRDEAIVKYKEHGLSNKQIAEIEKVTPRRIQQILAKEKVEV